MPSADELLYMIDSARFGKGDELSGNELAELGAKMLAMGVAALVKEFLAQ